MPEFLNELQDFLNQTAPGKGRKPTVEEEITAFLQTDESDPGPELRVPSEPAADPTPPTQDVPEYQSEPGALASATVNAVKLGIARGFLYPIGMFVPGTYRRISAELDEANRVIKGELTAREIADEGIRDFVAGTPGVVGEVVGSLVPGLGSYGVARSATGVARAATTAGKAKATIAAGALSGTAMSTFAELEDGESRIVRVLRDTAIGGAFELVGMPMLRRAWIDEIGAQTAKEVTSQVAASTGQTLEEVASRITHIRAGSHMDVEMATDLLRHLSGKSLSSPLAVRAKGIISQHLEGIIPEHPTRVDRALRLADPDFGVSFDMKTEMGSHHFNVKLPQKERALAGELSETDFVRQLGAVRQTLFELRAQGKQVKLDNVMVASSEHWRRFMDFMYGTKSSGAPEVNWKKVNETIGAAPAGSLAESGEELSKGAVVTVRPPGQPAIVARLEEGYNITALRAQSGLSTSTSTTPTFGNVAPEVPPGGFSPSRKFDPRMPALTPEDAFRGGGTVEDLRTRAGLRPAGPPSEAVTPTPNLADGKLTVSFTDKGTVKTMRVPPSQIFRHVDLQGAPAPVMKMKAHPDGTIRHGLIDLKTGDVRMESYGTPNKYFQGEVFKNIDNNDTLGPDIPRIFIHPDGEVTLSMAATDRVFDPSRIARIADETVGRKPGLPNRKPTILGKGMEYSPELVTARNSAKILLKKGVDPGTKLTAFVGRTFHRGTRASEPERTWTLQELADVEIPLPVIGEVQDEAGVRGLRAIPQGGKMIIRGDGWEKEFPTWADAHEFVVRQPSGERWAGKLETEVERRLGYGRERAFDPEIDSSRFRPVQMQEEAIREVIGGQRPAAWVTSKNPEALEGAVRGMTITTGKGMVTGVRTLALQAGTKGAAESYVVFHEPTVRQILARNESLLRLMGVPIQSVEEALRNLSARPHGLGILAGRDPVDSLLYTALRESGQRELWTLGSVAQDTLGRYRRYSPEQRARIRQELAERDLLPGARVAVAAESRLGGPTGPAPKGIQGPLEAPPDAAGSGGGSRDLQQLDLGDISGPPHPPFPDDVRPVLPDEPLEVISDVRGPRLRDYIRPMQELFKDYEANTGVPFYSWFQAIELGRTKVEAATSSHFGEIARLARRLKGEDRKQVQLLFESRFAGGYDDLAKSVSPEVKEAADKLEGIWRAYWQAEGLGTEEDFVAFFRDVPKLKTKEITSQINVFGRRWVSRPTSMNSTVWTNTALQHTERELDFATISRRMMRAMANDKYLAETWDDVALRLKAFQGAHTDSPWMSRYFEIFNRYRMEAMHQPDWWQEAISQRVASITKKLTGVELNGDEPFDLVSAMTSANYYANMAFQLGMTVRNYLQTLQTVYPVLGGRATGYGIKQALKWWKSKDLQGVMHQRGVIPRDAYVEPLRDMQRAVLESESFGKHAESAGKIMDLLDKGVQFYQSADNFNRVAAYEAQRMLAEEAGEKFVKGQSSWAEFMEGSKAEFRDHADGPLIKFVKDLMGEGKVKEAAHVLGLDFAHSSQFKYTRGNAAYFMQSTPGRFLLQYGTWPSWYVEWMRNHMGFTRGSAKSNAKVWGRWLAMNSAMYYGVSEAFGADFSRWTFFAPINYQGGPFMQISQQAWQTIGSTVSGEEDPVARINRARLMSQSWKQVVPLPIRAGENYVEALEQLNNENYEDFLRRVFALPEKKD